MEINKINNSYNQKSHNNLNFGLKIECSAQKVFSSINDFFEKNMLNFIPNNPSTTKFAEQMSEIRKLLTGCGIIHRKGGTGLCVSIPNVFKECKSKPDTLDTKIEFLHTPNQFSLVKLKSVLQKLEGEYNQHKKTYFDIHGKEYIPPAIFSEK